MRLEHDVFAKHELGSSLLRSRAERLAFLGAVDAIEADVFRMLVMQDFNGVAVENRDDAAGGRKWSTEDSAPRWSRRQCPPRAASLAAFNGEAPVHPDVVTGTVHVRRTEQRRADFTRNGAS